MAVLFRPIDSNHAEPEQPESSPEIFLEVDLSRGKGKAKFTIPTVLQLKSATAKQGAITGALGLSTEACLGLARMCCVEWGEVTEMPAIDKLGSRDYSAVVRRFNTYIGIDIPQEYQSGEKWKESEGESVDVPLLTGDIVTLRELTAEEMLNIEKVEGAVEQNTRMLVASCVAWNGEKLKWVDVMSNLNKMGMNDFYKLTEAFKECFLS